MLSKLVFIFDMLAGRLEVFPLLILLYPPLWRESYEEHKRKQRKREQMKANYDKRMGDK